MKKKGPSGVALGILELLKKHPDGLTSGEIREKLKLKPGEQMQLDRRKRDLYKLYVIEKTGSGSNPRYVYRGERTEPLALGFTQKVSAQIRHRARGRCGMCGKTIDEDHIKLVIDHKIPQSWGGSDDAENLWAICEECNAGKKDYFESFDPGIMREIMAHDSPHVRIGELLKMYFGKPVPGWLIEFVAFDQEDWMKRTRELRYLGWDIRATRKKNRETKRIEAFYTLNKFTKWIDNPTKWIRDFEASRARRNRGENDDDQEDL